MHSLEYVILQLAARIEKETGNTELTEDAKALASAVHGAFGETEDERFRALYARWSRAHDHVMRAE